MRWISIVLICCLSFTNGSAFSTDLGSSKLGSSEQASPNASLLTKYKELTSQLNNNQYQRPLYITSKESSNDLKGEIYAVINYPFATANKALNDPAHWCDVLILHVNVKHCHADNNKDDTLLTVNIGKKYDQPLEDAYKVVFNYHEIMTKPDYFAVELNAKSGPLSTRDYRIWLEATPISGGRTFLHFTYAYGFGMSGSIAMKGYLATIGRDKVGFTVIDKPADGQPNYIQGVRGVVERNTMRYYLAIDAYLAALKTPKKNQFEQRLKNWYNSTDQYARQLHEVEREDYMAMKRKEYERQQSTE